MPMEKTGIATSFRGSVLALVGALLGLAACGTPDPGLRMSGPGPHYKIGQPYRINAQRYHPEFVTEYEAVGLASWYGESFHGQPTANGETFDMHALTAAHPTLPLPSVVEVTNLDNGRRLVLRVNDRGPFVDDRLIDLSLAAASELGFQKQGLAEVRIRYLGIADLDQPLIRPGEQRQYVAKSCQLPQPKTLVC